MRTKPAPSPAERMNNVLTREDLSFALMRIFAAGAKGAGEGYHEKVMAHDAAIRAALERCRNHDEAVCEALEARSAALKKAEEENERLLARADVLLRDRSVARISLDAAESRVLSLEAERASWKTAAEDENKWLAAHNRAVAAYNVAIGDAQAAESRAETLEKALREIALSPHSTGDTHGGMYGIGVQDGHRCAATIAAAALEEKP